MSIAMTRTDIKGLRRGGCPGHFLWPVPGDMTTDFVLPNLTVPDVVTGSVRYGADGPTLAAQGAVTEAFNDLLTWEVETGVLAGTLKRVWFSIGGANTPTFANIRTILINGGPAAETMLDNFQAIHLSIGVCPGVMSVGFNLDYQEDIATLSDSVGLVADTLYDLLRCDFTFRPYITEDLSGAA